MHNKQQCVAPIRGTRILKDDTDWMEENLAGKQLVKKHKEISHTETGMFCQQRDEQWSVVKPYSKSLPSWFNI